MLTKHEGALAHLGMPSQKQVSEQSSHVTSSLVYSLDKGGEDMGPNQITAAERRDTRDCKHQQGGPTLAAS